MVVILSGEVPVLDDPEAGRFQEMREGYKA